MNTLSHHRWSLHNYQGIHSGDDFQSTFFLQALDRYKEIVGEGNLGSALTLCSSQEDAAFLARYPFTEIVVTGLGDYKAAVKKATNGDSRIYYHEENAEALSFSS